MYRSALLANIATHVAERLPRRTSSARQSHSPWHRIVAHWEKLWVAVILSIAGLAHGVNMFNFPYYENDEGVYVSQAWAILKLHELAPYTYWYDHAPLGWMQIALWSILTGGFYEFGTTIDSGRMLMLVMQVASTFMLYRIARNISGSVLTATLASLAFALSAYGLYFHRRVLLDNIATFWALLSILPLVGSRLTLKRIWFSGFALAAAILSKEIAVFLGPALAYLVFDRASHAGKAFRWYATIGWIALVGCIVSSWVLMATLKSELFPQGTFLGGNHEHVSLLGTLKYQASRGKDGGLLDFSSGFWGQTRTWAQDEPFLVIGGTIAAILAVLAIKRYRLTGIMGLAVLSLWLFLGRGGVIIGFYLVPLLPLLALCAGLVLGSLANEFRALLAKYSRVGSITIGGAAQVGILAVGLGLVTLGYSSPNLGYASDRFMLWDNTQANAQKAATAWIKENIPTDSLMIIDNGVWLDLHDLPNRADGFDNAHWYWKIDLDPEITDDVFHNNWRNTEYVVETFQMQQDAAANGLKIVSKTLEESTPVEEFTVDGYTTTVRRVHSLEQHSAPTDPLLVNTWSDYKGRFIDNGRVVDPGANQQTTSEAQSYAMLRAVYLNDRETFDQVWSWTEDNLQTKGNGLLAWRWGVRADGSSGVLDQASATDADVDTALALLFASKRWNAPEYKDEALEIMNGVWEQETVVAGGQRLLVAGDWARGDSDGLAVVNPSYFAPYAYRIFAEADDSHPWRELVDSSYETFEQMRMLPQFGGEVGLAPNWLTVDTASGGLLPAEHLGPRANEFSYDASRIPWRITLDYLWYGDERARETLKGLSFPERELESKGRLLAAYGLDGKPAADHAAISMYAGIIPGLLLGDNQDLAHEMFARKLLAVYKNSPEGAYWGENPNDYYGQNMAWFATAVMDGAMSNLWKGDEVIDWTKLQNDEPSRKKENPK